MLIYIFLPNILLYHHKLSIINIVSPKDYLLIFIPHSPISVYIFSLCGSNLHSSVISLISAWRFLPWASVVVKHSQCLSNNVFSSFSFLREDLPSYTILDWQIQDFDYIISVFNCFHYFQLEADTAVLPETE